MPNTYDYIIVGAGSAGCVLADRLSENGKNPVLVLEAGGSDKKFWVQVPLGYGKTLYDPAVNWMYNTEPQSGLDGNSRYWPRGKVLGGSSAINALVYIRGQQQDFDDWQDAENAGWGWEDVKPFFQKVESRVNVADVSKGMHPLVENFLQAGSEAGQKVSEDFIDQFEGVGRYKITVKNGRRMSAARAYLHPALKRKNLRLIKKAIATRILFDGKRAKGVEYDLHHIKEQAFATKEVILCGGAINSPQLLQLSGVGDATHLKSLGIDVILDQPNVGQHMQDHLALDYVFKSKVPTLNDTLNQWHTKLWEGFKYLAFRRGILARSINQAGGFIKSGSANHIPNVQLYFWPFSYTRAGRDRPIMGPDKFSAFEIGVQPCRPTSRGFLTIRSDDPKDHPLIDPQYFSTEHDVQEMITATKFIRHMAAQPAFKDVIESELLPGVGTQTDAEILDFIRGAAGTVFHPCGTCRMGADASANVVGPDLRVHGLEGLRVVDASVFPNVTSGNTNAPTMMVAEKAATEILG